MTRTSDGEWDSPAALLWESWVTRAINGKRGQAALRELEAALLALPSPRLGEGDLADEEGMVCTIGALYQHRHGKLPPDGYYEISDSAAFGRDELGLAWSLAWTLAEENDSYGVREKPEARYSRMLRWVREQIRPAVTG